MVIVRSTQHIWFENGALLAVLFKRIEREVSLLIILFKCNKLYQ